MGNINTLNGHFERLNFGSSIFGETLRFVLNTIIIKL